MPASRIRKSVFTTIFALCLVLGAGHPLAAGEKDAPASLKGFEPVKIESAKATSDRVINLVLPYIGNHPEAMEGRPMLDISIKLQGDSLIFDLKMGGYLDDSVSGEHFRGIIKPSPKGWELVDLGVKSICYRGKSKSGKCT